jgi:L,D-transpeptidase-like protein
VNKNDATGLASLFTDQANGFTVFDPNPETPGPLSIYASRSEVQPTSLPGAGDPYTSKDIYVVRGPYQDKPNTYGPNNIIKTDDEDRGRWLHGGGADLLHPRADRQGWEATHGCTRLQNQDVKDLTNAIRQFQRDHPGVKIPYERTRGEDYRKILTISPKERIS